MFEWIEEAVRLYATDNRNRDPKVLLFHILKGQRLMSLELSALTAAVARVSADVDKLIAAATPDPAAQAAVDAAAKALNSASDKADALLSPAPAA